MKEKKDITKLSVHIGFKKRHIPTGKIVEAKITRRVLNWIKLTPEEQEAEIIHEVKGDYSLVNNSVMLVD